jgi:hypothetical protein
MAVLGEQRDAREKVLQKIKTSHAVISRILQNSVACKGVLPRILMPHSSQQPQLSMAPLKKEKSLRGKIQFYQANSNTKE